MRHAGQLRFSTRATGTWWTSPRGWRASWPRPASIAGLVSVFVPGSTAAVTAMEYEPGGVHDLREALSPAGAERGPVRAQPAERGHQLPRPHQGRDRRPSETIPVRDGRLELGTWQQLVLVDFDDRPRQRTVLVHVVG